MGFFSKIVDAMTDFVALRLLQREIYKETVHEVLATYNLTDYAVNHLVSSWMQQIKADSKQAGTNNQPRNYGDYLLRQERRDMTLKHVLDIKRGRLVTNQDIRNWWNMHDLERRMCRKQYEHLSCQMWFNTKYYAKYGDSDSIDDDRLPYELMPRVNNYILNRASDPRFEEELARSSSFNEFVIKEIMARRL